MEINNTNKVLAPTTYEEAQPIAAGYGIEASQLHGKKIGIMGGHDFFISYLAPGKYKVNQEIVVVDEESQSLRITAPKLGKEKVFRIENTDPKSGFQPVVFVAYSQENASNGIGNFGENLY